MAPIPSHSTDSKNSSLRAAKRAKNDEFYTQLTDIEKELRHYRDHFKDKVVLCNCDDPFESNFFKYFAANFNQLGLRKLITTSYSGSLIASNSPAGTAFAISIDKVTDENGDGAIDIEDVRLFLERNQAARKALRADTYASGDFRSTDCVALLKEADIVVTNPPFSLFREYVAQLMGHQKRFLIIGNQNAVTYKEIFKHLKENQFWLGNTSPKKFKQPDGSIKAFGNILWFTNLSHKKRNEELILFRKYAGNEAAYPKYDNYDAIEVSKVADIPVDYEGAMGVPITFLDKYNPEQFEIVKFRKGSDEKDLAINGKCPYFRILIKRKTNKA